MYTLERVLDLVNAGDDIYCDLYRGDRKICEDGSQISVLTQLALSKRIELTMKTATSILYSILHRVVKLKRKG